MAKIVILGAGLTGLSAAYHLEKKGFFDYKLFEKEYDVGGLCKSITQDGFIFDFTGHLLHINDAYFLQFIKNVVGLEKFNHVARNSFIYSHGVHTNYPFQINLYGLPETTITECVEGFVRRKKQITPKNYYQWVLKHFGAGFGSHFFFPYQQKIFAYDPRKLTHSWTGRFVPATTLGQIIRGATINSAESVGYNAHFYYPKKGGISLLVKNLAKQLLLPIQKNFCATKINLQTKTVNFANGHTETFEQLISTIPLDLLTKNIQDRSATNFYPAHKKLVCNSVLNFNLGIRREHLSEKSWVYYPEKQFPFYRIGFPHTFSKKMVPPGNSSLYGEVSYIGKPPTNCLPEALAATKKLFGLTKQEIKTEVILHLKHAYVIYNQWREKHLESLLDQLATENIHSVGRYGAWKYASMQEAVLDGKQVAEKVLDPPCSFANNPSPRLRPIGATEDTAGKASDRSNANKQKN